MSKRYMMRRYDFSGGMDQSTNPFLLADNKFTYLKNVNHDELGTLSKDGGYSAFRTAAGSGSDDLVFDYVNWTGVHTPMKISNGTLYKAEIGGSDWTSVGAATTAGKRASAANYLNRMYIATESDNVRYYNGSTITTIDADNGGANVRGKYLERSYGRLFLGHITTVYNTNQVVYTYNQLGEATHRFYNPSEENHNTYATTSQKISVAGEITGLKFFQGLLLIFTEDAVWMWNPETLAEPKILAEVGCVAHDTIKEIDGILYWVSRDGVCRFAGNSMPTIISLPITNWTVNGIWRLIDGANWRNMNAGVLDGNYHLWVGDLTAALPGDSAALDDVVVVYDTYRDAWTFYDNHPVKQWATIVDSSGNKRLLMGNNDSGQTFMRDYSYSHNGSAIESVIRTKYFDFNNPEAEKVLSDFFVSYRPEGETAKYIEVGLAINGDNNYSTILDDSSTTRLPLTGDVAKEYQFERVSLGGKRARTASYEFKNADNGVNVTMLGYSQEFEYILPNMNYTT